MSPHIIATVCLLLVFVIGTVRPVNLGALALVAAVLVGGLVFDQGLKDVLRGFPADLFVLILGVTYLFAIATVNGTVDWLVDRLARLVGGRAGLVPYALFAVAAVPTSLGALGPASVAMLAPVSLRLARRYHIDLRLAGLMVICGSAAGNFSPLNPLGAIVNGTMAKAKLPTDPIFLFLVNFGYNVVLGLVACVVFGALPLRRRAVRHEVVATVGGETSTTATVPGDDSGTDATDATGNPGTTEAVAAKVGPVRGVTLASLAIVAVLSLGFDLDVGVCALTAAVLLTAIMPESSAGAAKLIGWNVILLICGVVTYVQMLDQSGTLREVGRSVAGFGSPAVGIVLLCAVAAVTSAFASSAGLISAITPLAVPIMMVSGAAAVPVVTAIAICTTVVDAAPFSSVGALTVTNTPEDEREKVHKGLLRWCGVMIVTAPLVTAAFLVLPAF